MPLNEQDPSDLEMLTSEYLDSTCSLSRLEELSQLLESRKDFREQFVAQVQLHCMLGDLYSKQKNDARVRVANAPPLVARRRKRGGRSQAA